MVAVVVAVVVVVGVVVGVVVVVVVVVVVAVVVVVVGVVIGAVVAVVAVVDVVVGVVVGAVVAVVVVAVVQLLLTEHALFSGRLAGATPTIPRSHSLETDNFAMGFRTSIIPQFCLQRRSYPRPVASAYTKKRTTLSYF